MSKKLLAACLALVLMLSVNAPSAGAEPNATFAIVVAKTFPADNISFGDLKRLYMGYAVNLSGTRVIPLGYRDRTPERVAFDRAVLGMDPDSVARYWIDRKIRGESGPPKGIESPDLLLRVVAKLDGAMGYVRLGESNDAVKVLKVDGKRPSDAGYRLRE